MNIIEKVNGGQAGGLVVRGRIKKKNLTVIDLNLNIKIWGAIIIIKCGTLR